MKKQPEIYTAEELQAMMKMAAASYRHLEIDELWKLHAQLYVKMVGEANMMAPDPEDIEQYKAYTAAPLADYDAASQRVGVGMALMERGVPFEWVARGYPGYDED